MRVEVDLDRCEANGLCVLAAPEAGQARTAAHTVLADLTDVDGALPHSGIPSSWSGQYDQKVLSVGLPHLADEATVVEGGPCEGRFVVAYGRRGQLVGAAGVGSARHLAHYRRAIAKEGTYSPQNATQTIRPALSTSSLSVNA